MTPTSRHPLHLRTDDLPYPSRLGHCCRSGHPCSWQTDHRVDPTTGAYDPPMGTDRPLVPTRAAVAWLHRHQGGTTRSPAYEDYYPAVIEMASPSAKEESCIYQDPGGCRTNQGRAAFCRHPSQFRSFYHRPLPLSYILLFYAVFLGPDTRPPMPPAKATPCPARPSTSPASRTNAWKPVGPNLPCPLSILANSTSKLPPLCPERSNISATPPCLRASANRSGGKSLPAFSLPLLNQSCA